MIVDATAVAGKLYLLADDAAVYSQEKPNDIAWQNTPHSQRPVFIWQRHDGPPVAVPARLIVGHTGELRVLGDGQIWEKVRDSADPNNLTIPAYIWRPLALPGEEVLPAVNPPAPVRAEILTIADGGAGVNATANANRKGNR